MPQLDKVTFFSQFFWLAFFFLGFYIILLKYFLPKMSIILKFRKKKMSFSGEGVTNLGKENEKVRTSYQTILSNGCTSSRKAFNENFREAENWLKDTVLKTNQTTLGVTNKNYIIALGEKTISQNLALNPIFTGLADRPFFSQLLRKLKSLNKVKKGDTFLGIVKDQNSNSQKKGYKTSSVGTEGETLNSQNEKENIKAKSGTNKSFNQNLRSKDLPSEGSDIKKKGKKK